MTLLDEPIDPRVPRPPHGPDCLFWMRLHTNEILTGLQRLESSSETPEDRDMLNTQVTENVRALKLETDRYKEFLRWMNDPKQSEANTAPESESSSLDWIDEDENWDTLDCAQEDGA